MRAPKIALATIVLNEGEFIAHSIDQHANWPGLVAWVIVEGACRDYAEANPTKVTDRGLSTDDTSKIVSEAAGDIIKYIPYGFAEGGSGEMGHQKRELRNVYCDVLDSLDDEPDLLIVIDADEFYTETDQHRIRRDALEVMLDHDAWLLPQRHLWRPPSIAHQSRWGHEVLGGYWSVPHTRVWRYQRGAAYVRNHNELDLPTATSTPRVARHWDDTRGAARVGLPSCVHLGFARGGAERAATNKFYVARGEGRETAGRNRQSYVDCRAAWEVWNPNGTLPHGARVVPYSGPVPECFAGELADE